MPRSRRITHNGGFYHVYNRGTQKSPVCIDEEDFQRIMTTMQRFLLQCDCIIYAYCFLPNHYHMLIEERRVPIAKFISKVFTSYGLYFNWKHHGCGPLFQDRFKSKLVQKNTYFLELSRYIHCNPLKALLCQHAGDYRYSSFGEYIGTSPFHIINRDAVLRLIGDSRRSLKEYTEFVEHGKDEDLDSFDPFLQAEEILGSRAFITHRKKVY